MSHRSNRTVALTSLGCKVNQADAEEWLAEFLRLGYEIVPFGEVADAYVVNTCTVTHVADRKSRQTIRQARRLNPAGLVVATGCYASVAAPELARLAEVDLVVGGADKARLVPLVHEALEGTDALPAETAGPGERHAPSRTRAFVKIGDGCDKLCAFCIVPYARGRARSVPLEEVLAKVRERARAGFREIVLTAVHMGSYGTDLEPRRSLREAVAAILAETGVERLRLSSIEPEDFDAELLGLWRDVPDRLCRHFHLALDSGCDDTLRRMRRRYTAAQYAALVETIRAAVPGVAITTDVMVGFPGETDAEFAASVRLIEALEFSQIHVFKYSQRRRTVAARLPDQVAEPAKSERLAAMLEVAAASAQRFRTGLVGQVLPALYETRGEAIRGDAPAEPFWEGLTDNYARVFVAAPPDADLTNRLIQTRIVGTHPDGLSGEI